MLNLRHKTLLFITVVVTGTSLLAGVSLTEGVGLLMLGIAVAWLVGSDTVSKIGRSIPKIPNKVWPWVKIPVLMAVGGCLLAVTAFVSGFNSFVVNATLAIFGLAVAGPTTLNIQRRWLRAIVWVLGIAIFMVAAVAVSVLFMLTPEEQGKLGELAVYSLISFALGRLWLIKGWRLIQRGITSEEPHDTTSTVDGAKTQRVAHIYALLFLGVVALTLWLGLMAFSAFSDSTFAFEFKPKANNSNPLSPVFALMLVAWWPYSCWRSILQREPNTAHRYLARHKVVTGILGGFFTIVVCVAATFGIQNGNDRMATHQIETSQKDFQDAAVKIGGIKGRDLQTTRDYINAYEEVEPLMTDFDQKLDKFTSIIHDAQARNKTRGPLNIQHVLYGRKYSNEWLAWDENTYGLLRQDSELTRKQIEVVKQMAQLPEADQVIYWKENFLPLSEQEVLLRSKLETAQKNMPQGR